MKKHVNLSVITMHPYQHNGERVTPDFSPESTLDDVFRWYRSADAQRVRDAFLAEGYSFMLDAILNNQIARQIMEWHVINTDPHFLWRTKDGVKVAIVDKHGARWDVCAHPYRYGVNLVNHLSFNPMLNYHADLIDWREVVKLRKFATATRANVHPHIHLVMDRKLH